jgi:hypothetical protein
MPDGSSAKPGDRALPRARPLDLPALPHGCPAAGAPLYRTLFETYPSIPLKTLLRMPLSEGIAVTTATIPAARAHSTRSCPLVSCKRFRVERFIV